MFSIGKRKYHKYEIDPDEIFLDSHNLPEFDEYQFEGRLEKPLSKSSLIFIGIFSLIIVVVFSWQLAVLQIVEGQEYRARAENNRLHQTLIFAERGIVKDRDNKELAWNEVFPDSSENLFARRNYISEKGFAHLLGYVRYPQEDVAGFYYKEELEGVEGIESAYDEILAGRNGMNIIETNASGQIQAESIVNPPKEGDNLILTIDARIQSQLYAYIEDLAEDIGFSGGAGVLMDIELGDLLAMVSYPEYDSAVLSSGKEAEKINVYRMDEQKPFLNRALGGLYAPGSIVKPFIALGALIEGVITPEKEIMSTGSIAIQNPYFPEKKSVFNDWKAHGLVDMRRALAVSSDVYFYEIGGGYENQKGIGIANIEKYMRMFGFGEITGINTRVEKKGVIPNPEWKTKIFNDTWRVGDTYITAIGQYGFQVTPIQVVRATAAIVNGGVMLTPRLVMAIEKNSDIKSEYKDRNLLISKNVKENIPIKEEFFKVVREGMRDAVRIGTAKGLDIPQVSVGAKTGTAEIGITKEEVHSWVIGFFPYEKPRYAFAVVMERGPEENTIGALYVMRKLLEWMAVHTPEYLK